MTPESDDAGLAVLEVALEEALGAAAPPDLWPRLQHRPRRWSWLAAAVALLAVLVVVAVAVLRPRFAPAQAPVDQRWREVDPRGPHSLEELGRWLTGEVPAATLQAEATFAPALSRSVMLSSPILLGLFEPAAAHPALPIAMRAALTAALAQAVPAPDGTPVVWEHSIELQFHEHRARVLLRRPDPYHLQAAIATPEGGLRCAAFPFTDRALLDRLQECTEATIAARGIVIGDRGMADVPRNSKRLILHGVTAAAASQLGQFAQLAALDLCDAPACHAPEVMRLLARLPVRNLSLCGASLDEPTAAALGDLVGLTELYCLPPDGFVSVLAGGPVPAAPALGPAVRSLARLKDLEALELCGAMLRDADLAVLAALPKLQRLGLPGGTGFDGSGLEAFGGRLAGLDLRGTGIADPSRALAPLSGLRTLLLGNPDRPVDLRQLGSCPALEELCIDGRLEPAQLAAIQSLQHLRTLRLRPSPPLGDAALVALHGATQLRSLGLEDSRVSPAGIDALKAALPECRIALELW